MTKEKTTLDEQNESMLAEREEKDRRYNELKLRLYVIFEPRLQLQVDMFYGLRDDKSLIDQIIEADIDCLCTWLIETEDDPAMGGSFNDKSMRILNALHMFRSNIANELDDDAVADVIDGGAK